MALHLLCDKKGDSPCLACNSCKLILHNAHPDFQVYHPFPSQEASKLKEEDYWQDMRDKISGLIESPYLGLSFEKEAHLSIQTLRFMQENLFTGKNDAQWRVVVLCNVHQMQEEAANSVLKILEEPRPNVLFLLFTSHPHLLLPTLVSRCQILRLSELSQSEILSYLKAKFPQDPPEKLLQVSHFAAGSISRAVEYLEGGLDEALACAQSFMQCAEKDDIASAMELTGAWTQKRDVGLLKKSLEIVLIAVRNACILKSAVGVNFPASLSPERAGEYTRAIQRILLDLQGNVSPNLLVFCHLRGLQKSVLC
jgi:hypothetical protein